jgi:hypothetical protein
MAIAQGFGKTSTNGLIFGYDTGDMDNSFKGAPKTNLLSVYSRTYGNQSSSVFKTQYYTREVFVPTLGTRSVETMETYNDYGGGSGVCCQGAWYFGGAGVAGSTQYTYSIIYRSNSGYTHPNFMYRYEYGASGYITEGGLHNDGNRTHLGDGWYHAWGNMTTQPGTTSMSFYFYMYEYGTYNTIDIAGVMFTQGPEIIRPRQFIPFSTTRTSTQSLLDLTEISSINTSNVSFNSTGQLIFDGTDDSINVNSNFGVLSQYTIEHVSNIGSVNRMPISSVQPPLFYHYADNSWYYTHGGIAGEYYYPKTASINSWGHWVITYDGSAVKIYRNGIFEGQQSTSGTADWRNGLRIGNYTYGGYPWNGQISVVKMYNRALSATEITQNYSHYKTRFNL